MGFKMFKPEELPKEMRDKLLSFLMEHGETIKEMDAEFNSSLGNNLLGLLKKKELSEGAIKKIKAIVAEDLKIPEEEIEFSGFELRQPGEKTAEKMSRHLQSLLKILFSTFPGDCENCRDNCMKMIEVYLHKLISVKMSQDKEEARLTDLLCNRTIQIAKSYIDIKDEDKRDVYLAHVKAHGALNEEIMCDKILLHFLDLLIRGHRSECLPFCNNVIKLLDAPVL